MAFDFYFTGVPSNSEIAEFLIENNACVLLSQLNERSNILKWIDKLKEHPESTTKLFIDSGAFSAWTKGKTIDVDEYINFINTNKDYLEVCASVDNIPGVPRSSQVASPEEVFKSAEKTWENFLYMRSKMDDVDKLLYTYHAGEPLEFLTRALEFEDDRGRINYIALGGLVGKTEAVINGLLCNAFKVINKSNNPNLRIHAFGMTRLKYLEMFPFTSADSTSWLQTANYGSICLNSKTFCISDRKLLDEDNILNKNPAIQEELTSAAAKCGYTLQDLLEDSNKRLMFNVKNCFEWASKYSYKGNNMFKKSLW